MDLDTIYAKLDKIIDIQEEQSRTIDILAKAIVQKIEDDAPEPVEKIGLLISGVDSWPGISK